MYFIFGMLATLVIIGIVVGVADYQELQNKVSNNSDELKAQWRAIKELDKMERETRDMLAKREVTDEKRLTNGKNCQGDYDENLG